MASRSIVSWVGEPTRFRITPAIHDEEDRRVQELGDVGGRGELPTPALAVEETHYAFHDGDVGPTGAVGEERAYEVRAGEEDVEVAAGPPGGERVVGRIYEVRADLEGGDFEALHAKGRHEARSDGGLSCAGVGARDDDARGSYHSMPFWPR
jgi:hypothetical protein